MVNSDFRVCGTDRGNYFPETDRIIVFLHPHETLDDLLSTIHLNLPKLFFSLYNLDEGINLEHF